MMLLATGHHDLALAGSIVTFGLVAVTWTQLIVKVRSIYGSAGTNPPAPTAPPKDPQQ